MNTTRDLFDRLPSPAISLAILIGTAELTIFGVRGLTNPRGWLDGFGLPVVDLDSGPRRLEEGILEDPEQGSEEVHSSQRALTEAVAARNIQNGVVILTFACVVRDRRALGIAVTAGLITTIADALVVWRHGSTSAVYGHLVGIANCAGIGGSLLLLG